MFLASTAYVRAQYAIAAPPTTKRDAARDAQRRVEAVAVLVELRRVEVLGADVLQRVEHGLEQRVLDA